MSKFLFRSGVLFFMALFVAAGAFLLHPELSEAAQSPPYGCQGWYGRHDPPRDGCWHGYFYDGYNLYGADVIPGGLSVANGDKAGFISRIEGYLYGADPHLKTAAQFIILTMLGNNAGVAKSVSPAQQADWESRINNSAISLVVHDVTFTCNIANSFYQGPPDDPGMDDIAAGYSDTPDCGVLNTMIDFYYTPPAGGAAQLVYRIRVACGNPLGQLPGLPQPQPTIEGCGLMNLVPNSPPEVNATFQIVATITFSGGPNPPVIGSNYMTVNGVGVPFSPPVVSGAYASGYTLTFTSGNLSEATPGQYTVAWGAQINELGMKDCGGVTDAGAKFNVLTHPFLKVDGGDVNAGSGFAATDVAGNVTQPCPAPTSNSYAGITSWNNGAPSYTGAGTQYGVFVLNLIHNFASNLGSPNPSSLSFANTSNVNLPAGLFGGYFGKPPCVDYWDTKQPVANMNALPGSNLNVNSLNSSGDYYHSGNLTIVGGGNVKDKVRATVYVNGDVTIKNDITYASAASGWASVGDISSFRLVVHGRIFIDKSVQNLDGVYVAIPNAGYQTAGDNYGNPNAGTIVTCSNGSSTYDPNTPAGVNGIQSQCGSLLTVYGSLIANHIFLLRTGGTASSNTPAEYIRYSPEEWLAPPSGGKVDTSYQAITGLPPVL